MTSFKIIVLLLWIIATATSTSTDKQCECHVNHQLHIELLCRDRELTSIPDLGGLNCNAESLDISHNQLSILPDDTFTSTTNIKRVYLYLNNLDSLEKTTFQSLGQLQEVDLSDNDLLDIDPDLFVNNPLLEKVILSGNPLVELSTTTPVLVSQSITQLDMSNCKLTTLTQAMLSSLPRLQSLDVSSNGLEHLSLQVFQFIPVLTSLVINNNRWNCDCSLRDLMDFKMAITELTALPEKRVRCFNPQRHMITWSQDAETRYCPNDDLLPVTGDVLVTGPHENNGTAVDYGQLDWLQYIVAKAHIVYAMLFIFVLFVVTVSLAVFTVRLVTRSCRSSSQSFTTTTPAAADRIHNKDNHFYMVSSEVLLSDKERLMRNEVVPVYSDILPLNFQHPARSLVHIYEPIGKVDVDK